MTDKLTLSILSDLVSFDTTSSNSNLAIIEYIKKYLSQFSIKSNLIYNKQKNKANLFATLGENNKGGVILSGHTDVVSTQNQTWQTSPFQAVEKDNKVFGRGCTDMKGFLAICLANVENIIKAKLTQPIHLAFSYDEEVGCIGVRDLIKYLKKQKINPDSCIVGEPTEMKIITAHKGMLYKSCSVKGKAIHSCFANQGVNSISLAAKAISYIDELFEKIKTEGPFDNFFTPPYTTLHCGVIKGGTVNNIVPDNCTFEFEIRNIPQDNPEIMFSNIVNYIDENIIHPAKKNYKNCRFEWKEVAKYPGLDDSISKDWIKKIQKILKSNSSPATVSYGTEAGLFNQAGIPSVICGPGSIKQAHRPDEFIEISQIKLGNEFIKNLIISMLKY